MLSPLQLHRFPRAPGVHHLLSACLMALSACSSSDGGSPPPGAGSNMDAGGDASDSFATTEITVGDFTFHARVAGPPTGELVLLLHGFPETSYEWRNQLTALGNAGYYAVAPDQRGYSPGARPEDVSAYGVVTLAQDAIGMTTALGAQRFHVVGHDWGAAVAWVVGGLASTRVISLNTLSVPHPDAFAKVLADMTSCQYSASSYFDTFSQPNSEDALLANDAATLRALWAGIDQDAVNEYLSVLGTKDALGAALNWYRANVSGRMLMAGLGPISVPTMYVWSDADVALCKDGADLTADYVTGPYRFEVLAGVSHWIADVASDRLTPLLLDHIGTYREKP